MVMKFRACCIELIRRDAALVQSSVRRNFWPVNRTAELHSLYHSPNIDRVIKSRRLRWAGHVADWKKVGVLSKF